MLVSLCGSDVQHALLLSCVSHSLPIRWLSLRPPFAFPRAKSGRVSYEGYVAEGVMRGHWVLKHKYVIPSVALVVLDWQEAAPYESQEVTACMRLAKVRGELQGRDSRVALLVVKATRFASQEEEAAFVERLQRGIKKTGVDPPAPLRSVLVVVSSDAKASFRRVEPAVHELSLDYYRSAVRRLKAMKGRISRSAQPLLYVRHQLKAAYFSETMKDVAAAVKHYSHAHSALVQHVVALSPAALSSPVAHELRAVGLVLNHRLCRLLLSGSKWSEALEQFQLHLAAFKRCTGLPDLLFAQYEHLAQAFELFGDLLEHSSYHMPTSQPRQRSQVHSGYFYHTAATYAGKRKLHAQLALTRQRNGSLQVPALLPPAQLAPAAHLGQARLPYSALLDDARGVSGFSTFVQSSDPSDLLRSVLSVEAVVEHSALTIALLNKSCSRYQKEHSERMLVSVASQTASEYFTAKQWRKAQTLFDRIATTYREEQWWMILTSTLMAAYTCAKELGQQKETVHYALELLGRYATTTTEQKERIHHTLLTLLSAPEAQGGLQDDPGYVVDAPLKFRLIECDAAFLTTPVSVVYAYTALHLVLVLDYHFPLPVSCSSIQLTFNHPQYHLTLLHDGSPPPAAPNSSSTSDDENGSGEAVAAPIHLQASASGEVVTRLHFRPNRSLTLHVEMPASTAPSTPLSLVHLISHVLLGPGSRVLRLRSWPNRREDEEALQPVYTKAGAANGVTGEEDSAGAKKKAKKAAKKGGKGARSAAEREEERRREEAERELRAAALSTKLGSVSIVPPPPAVRLHVTHPSPPLLHELYPLIIRIDSHTDDLTQATLSVTAVDAERAAAAAAAGGGEGGDGGAAGDAHSSHPAADGHLGASVGSKGDHAANSDGTPAAPAGAASDSAAATAGGTPHGDDAAARFYTRADALASLSSSSPAVLSSAELVELTSALPLPRLAPHGSCDVTVFVRLSSLHPHRVSLTLSYLNGHTAFHQSTTQRVALTAKPALHLTLKPFTQHTQHNAHNTHQHAQHHTPHTQPHHHQQHPNQNPSSTSSQSPAAAVHLQVHQRAALHCEVDNASPHPLALTDIRLALPKAAFEVEDATTAADTRAPPTAAAETVGLSAALQSSSLFVHRHTRMPLLPPSSSSSSSSPLCSPCVLLAPGERYIHVFYFTPRTAGRVLSSHVSLAFTRVQLPAGLLQQPASSSPSPLLAGLSASADGGRGAAGHSLSEKQREDLLKRLVEEQKLRATGGEAAAASSAAAASFPLSPAALSSPSSSSSAAAPLAPPSSASGESVVVAALQELRVAEAEEAEEEKRRGGGGGAQGEAEDAALTSSSKAGALDEDATAASAPAASLDRPRPAPATSPSAGRSAGGDASGGSAASLSGSSPHSFPCIPVSFSQALPSLLVSAPPLQLRLHYPAVAALGQPFSLALDLHNATEHAHTAHFTIHTPHHHHAAHAQLDTAAAAAPHTAATAGEPGGAAAAPPPSLPHSLAAAAAASPSSPAPSLSSAAPPATAAPPAAPAAAALAPPRLLLAGAASGLVRLLPSSSHRLQWRCVPLDCGFVQLPRLEVHLLHSHASAEQSQQHTTHSAHTDAAAHGSAQSASSIPHVLLQLDEDERLEVFVQPAGKAQRSGGEEGGAKLASVG